MFKFLKVIIMRIYKKVCDWIQIKTYLKSSFFDLNFFRFIKPPKALFTTFTNI